MNDRQRWGKVTQIFSHTDEEVWDRTVRAPNVVRVGDTLRMYYHGEQGAFRRTGLAETDVDDPFSWEKHPDNPVLDLGPADAIDSHWAGYPWVIPITDSHWHMYYGAWGGDHLEGVPERKRYYTALAESDDGGFTWRRTGTPLLDPDSPFRTTGSCAVIEVGGEYWMYYTDVYQPRSDFYRISISRAVSTDGGHSFEPDPAERLLDIPPRIGDPGSTCSKPYVERTDGSFRLWFSCATDGRHYRVHYAESEDGVHFKWLPAPVLDVSDSGWDADMTAYPFVLHLEDRTLMYYNSASPGGLGVAELVDDGLDA